MGAILASTFWVCSWGNRGSAWPYFRGGEGISWNQTQQQREPCSVWPCAWQPGLPPGPGGDAAPLQGPVGPHLALAGGGVAPFPGGNISGLGPGLGGVQELQNSQQNPGPEPPVWGTGAKVAGLVQPVPVLSMTRSHGGARGRRGGSWNICEGDRKSWAPRPGESSSQQRGLSSPLPSPSVAVFPASAHQASASLGGAPAARGALGS